MTPEQIAILALAVAVLITFAAVVYIGVRCMPVNPAPIVAAAQALVAERDALKAQVATLSAAVADLQSQVNADDAALGQIGTALGVPAGAGGLEGTGATPPPAV